MNPNAPQNGQLDPQVVSLVKAVRQVESGGVTNAKGQSGEYGPYQYTPGTWATTSQQYLGKQIPLEQATPEQQTEATYKRFKELKDKGLTPDQIASIHNSGKPNWQGNVGTNSQGVHYDTPAYVNKVYQAYQQFKAQTPEAAAPQPQQPEGYQPWFQAAPDDSGLTAGLKAIGNTIPSAINFGKGVLNAINPINTLKNLSEIPAAFEGALEANGGSVTKTLGSALGAAPAETYKQVVPKGIQQVLSGDIGGASKTFTEDPFGQAAPIVLAAEGGAKLADTAGGGLAEAAQRNFDTAGQTGRNIMPTKGIYQEALDKGISKAAGVVTKPAGALGKALGSTAKFGVSQLTGLDPKTIDQIISSPSEFTKGAIQSSSRSGVASEVGDALDQKISDLQETGKEYGTLRKNGGAVTVPQDGIVGVLKKYGITLGEDGSLETSAESTPLSPGDKSALQAFMQQYGKESTLSPNAFLNTRTALSNLSKYDAAKTGASQSIARDLRGFYDGLGKDQLPGLKELDSKYAPQAEQLKQLKKDYLQPNGEFKDGSVNKIVNAGGKGKDALLSRLEELKPGITQKIKVLKAIEDIQHASGHKVGTYTRSAIGTGGLLSGVITGNVPVMLASIAEMIVTNPDVATIVIRRYGLTKAQIAKVTNLVKEKIGEIPASQALLPGLVKNK